MVGQPSWVVWQITACSCISFFKYIFWGWKILPAELRAEILVTNPMQPLADGLGCDVQSAQEACAVALHFLAKHSLSTSWNHCPALLSFDISRMSSRNYSGISFSYQISQELRTGTYFRWRESGVLPGRSWYVLADISPTWIRSQYE